MNEYVLYVSVEMYSTEEGLEATFQIVNFIAWSPDPSQVNWLTVNDR